MKYISTALWLLVIGVSFGLGWSSFWLLALGMLAPVGVLVWGLVRCLMPAAHRARQP